MSCTNLKWSDDIRYIPTNSIKIPEEAGVYKVLRNDGKEGEFTRVYVGKAVSLRGQYDYHLSYSEENFCLKMNLRDKECYFRYALLSGEQNRKDTESHLLSSGKYECNNQEQEGGDFK